MKRLLVASILLFAAHGAHAGSCDPARLRPEEWSSLMTVAKSTVERRIDGKTVVVCRLSEGFIAGMLTVREKQPDGSELWERMECSWHREDSGAWTCERYPERRVPLESRTGVPVKVVELPIWMKVEDAQPLVMMVYESLPTLTGENLCRNNWAGPTGIDAMRRAFMARDRGVLFLFGESAAKLSLNRNGYFVDFTPDAGHALAVRVDCWGRIEELEE